MSYTLTDKLFGFFGVAAKREDAYKDISGKGINERYQQCLGEDYDENVRELIDEGLDNISDPALVFSKFIILLEYMVGMPLQIDPNDDALRRKMLWLNNTITLTKGSIISYKILLNLIGVTDITVTLADRITGFDSIETFDSDTRRFDGRFICCSHYSIDLLGDPVLDADLAEKIKLILYYLQPIDSELDSVTYNSDPISLP